MYHTWRSYDIWFQKCKVQQRKVFVILGHFVFCHPPNNPENQKFKILTKKPGDIIILHMCTLNNNHMMYGSWDMECDRQKFLSFGTIFALLPSYGPRKSKFWKNKNNAWRY